MSTLDELVAKIEDLWHKLDASDANPDGLLEVSHLKTSIQLVGFVLPNNKIVELGIDLKKNGKLNNGCIDKTVFIEICTDIFNDPNSQKYIEEDIIVETKQGKHTVSVEEQRSFARWISGIFAKDSDLSHLLPLRADGGDMYAKMGDGLILCKIINLIEPDAIDLRAIHKGAKTTIFQKHENLNAVMSTAKTALGVNAVTYDTYAILEGKQHLILGLLWQLIKQWLFKEIYLVAGLAIICGPNYMLLKPEEILLKWVNYQLEKAGVDKRIKNFEDDLKDSIAYIHLIFQISPESAGVNKSALNEGDLMQRAEKTLGEAEKIGCREFVEAEDIVNGHELLNLAFVGYLFLKYPAIEVQKPEPVIVETREEKMYRNWMNSLGLSQHVNWLYLDTNDGLIYIEIFDIIEPGLVDWSRVKRRDQYSSMAALANLEKLENCNYVVELAKDPKIDFVVIGLQGQDIREGNKTLVLGMVWQLMRAYILAILKKLSGKETPISEDDILAWVNKTLSDYGQKTLANFSDAAVKTSLPLIYLIDAMFPGKVDFAFVYTGDDLSDEKCLDNAKYAYSTARKFNALIYALPEDMVEIKDKMVMTVFASLMLLN